MSQVVAQMQNVCAESFRCHVMCVQAGDFGLVCVRDAEQGRAFVDLLLGLTDPGNGTVELLGTDLYQLPESRRLSLLSMVSHVGGGMISNLSVWENLALPALFHRVASADEVECRLMEALERLPNKEEWMRDRLPALPDALSPFASRVAGLLRAGLSRPRLLVAEFLLDDLDDSRTGKLVQMIEGLRNQDPTLAVLLIHLGPISARQLALHDLRPSWTMNLKDIQHEVPETH